MYVWKLWNPINYSTAYVVAESRAKAKCIRPDGAIWDRLHGWRLPMTWVPGGIGGGNYRETPTPQTLEGWPAFPDDVYADRFARVERPFGAEDTHVYGQAELVNGRWKCDEYTTRALKRERYADAATDIEAFFNEHGVPSAN